MAEDENIIGVAWCQTSVVDDLWDYDYDEEQDEIIPYNIFKGDGHFNLFDDIEDIEKDISNELIKRFNT